VLPFTGQEGQISKSERRCVSIQYLCQVNFWIDSVALISKEVESQARQQILYSFRGLFWFIWMTEGNNLLASFRHS